MYQSRVINTAAPLDVRFLIVAFYESRVKNFYDARFIIVISSLGQKTGVFYSAFYLPKKLLFSEDSFDLSEGGSFA